MRTFEIHITGEESINSELDDMKIKNIIIKLLRPDKTHFRTEYMSSFISKFKTYEECKTYVDDLVSKLKSKIIRVKIECPIYHDYILRSVYVESHFVPNEKYVGSYPMSQNQKSGKIMCTDREYDKTKYNSFIDKWKNEDVELCLYDDYIREDFDWFKLY
jgi:hypothetical protein